MPTFVGRKDDLQKIEATLVSPGCSLLTLVGPGGVGKTQLALQIANRLSLVFPDGVFFVDLSLVKAHESIVGAIVNQIELFFPEAGDPDSQFIAAMRGKHSLIVLDNFEHLVSSANTLANLLTALPQLTFLVTSRTVLRLTNEQVYPVEGLAVPDNHTVEPYSIDAIDLFLACAQRVQPDFSITNANVQDVTRLCRLVDGVPLAIELAAAWMRVLSVEDIVLEIERCLDFLVSDARDLPERHRSLRAVFQNSWNQLGPEAQTILRRLAIFPGTFDRRAAETVTGATLSHLLTLVDSSLVRRVDETRFKLHMVIREYAHEQLEVSNQTESLQRQHSIYYSQCAQTLTKRLKGSAQVDALEEIDGQIDNFRAGWFWAAHQRNQSLLENYLELIVLYYQMRSRPAQCNDLLVYAQSRLAPDQRLYNIFSIYRAWLLIELGRPYEGLALTTDLLTYEDNTDLFVGLSLPLGSLTYHPDTLGDAYTNLHYILENNVQQASSDLWEVGFAHFSLGHLALMQGRYSDARTQLENGLQCFNSISDAWGKTWILGTLGRIAYEEQSFNEAIQYFEMGGKICADLGDMSGYEYFIRELAQVASSLGDTRIAIEHLITSTQLGVTRTSQPAILTYPLQQISYFLVQHTRPVPALEILVQLVDHPYVRAGWWQSEIDHVHHVIQHLKADLPAHVFNAARLRGLSRNLQQTADFAIQVLQEISEQAVSGPPSASNILTGREMEVLQLLAQGQTNRQIASHLTVSLSTAKTHVHNITGKLDATNRTEAVSRARLLGLI